MADGTDRVSPWDPAVEPSADGSTGLWWRESHVPVQVGTTHLIDFIAGADATATTYPRDPLPSAMSRSSATTWLALLRLGERNGRVALRLASGVPGDIAEAPPYLAPGPDLSDAVEASLRIVIRYRAHLLTLAPPVAGSDPYIWVPANAADVIALCRAVRADLDADTAQPADIALLRAEAALGVDVSDPAAPTLGVPGAEEIARSLSPSDVVLTAMEIRHPDIAEPVRVVNDLVDHEIGGETFVPLRFDARAITDEEGRAPRAEIQVDNVGQVLTEWLERAQGGAGATVRAMWVLARTHEVEQEMTVGVLSVEVRERIHVRLGWDPLLQRPAVGLRHDRYTSPGAFGGA